MGKQREQIISCLSACITFVIGIAVLGIWLSFEPAHAIVEHVPGMDGKPDSLSMTDESVSIGSYFNKFDHPFSYHQGSWPRFRGERFDNIGRETTPLADSWPAEGPPVLWTVDLGEGHGAPAVYDGRVFLLDYDETRRADALRCFSLADGSELWRRWYTVVVKRNHGMSRTIPAVTGKYVVTMGPRCHVMCVGTDTGGLVWGIDLEKKYGTEVPMWYTAQCPLIDNDIAVIAPGGTSLMIGVDCETGKVIWETSNPDGWHMSHSSIMPMSVSGTEMYVYASPEGIAGIGAHGNVQGRILWKTSAWSNAVIAPSPVVFPDGRIFVTAGYGAGSMMLKVAKKGEVFETEVLASWNPGQGLASEQQTPILYRGHLFGILPKDAGTHRTQFVCFHPDGTMVWTSGREHQFGLGPYLLADGKFYILQDDGELFMIRATTEGYE
jgi:outer membrane protein assembly factor BamB